MANEKHNVNVGLYSTAADAFTPAEGDLWYNNTDGNVKTQIVARTSATGPTGMTPEIYGIANGWYSVLPGGGIVSGPTDAVTNNRAYAYPLYPGRKCVLADFAMFITDTAGTGNLRMMLYGCLASGLPGALIADYGTRGSLTANTVITGWTAGTTLQPAPYWLVLAAQTSVAPSMLTRTFYSPLIPELSATPPSVLVPSSPRSSFISDTGFAGAPPSTFGAVTAAHVNPPFMYLKLTQ